jgi:hypothetical protein
MLVRWVRRMIREAIALSRNYQHAAILRRRLRTKYGAVLPAGPSVAIGDALVALNHARWRRLLVLIVLFMIAARSKGRSNQAGQDP